MQTCKASQIYGSPQYFSKMEWNIRSHFTKTEGTTIDIRDYS